jgi:ATP-binding cassette subfamily A (ABC1) protein 3
MKVMGLSGWLHWWAHFITNFVKLALAVAVITLILCIDVGGKKIVERSDPTLIFVYLLLYAACTVWYSFAVSTFFHNGMIFIAV